MKNWLKHITCLLLFLGGVSFAFAQTEEEIKESANQLFKDEKYVEATSKYLQLLALNPRNHNYNYKYGTCLLYNSKRKDKAFKYLNYSVKGSDVDPEAFYYLGKAFHLTFQFSKAIRNFEIYKTKAGSKALKKLNVDRQIQMCQNGKRLLQSINELIVVNKKEIRKSDFFRLYNLQNIGGTILVTEDFQSKTDKKNKHVPLIHFPNNPRTIYYSSYGEGQSHKDIFMRKKLPSGKWSLPQKVLGGVNTSSDEDFPYMHPNGTELYFCSKGHNSMGGYDIFKSVLDPETGKFGDPRNIDFAISSPDDDVFYVVDSLDKNAYFASSRQSENGKLYVYQVRVERFPMQMAILKGKFNSKINPQNKKISIDIEDYASGKKMGNFKTNKKGDYLINLPRGGKYYFYVQVDGSNKIHKALVDVPFLKEFRPLKQAMEQFELDANEKLKISNLFNEGFDDPSAILAEIFMEKAELKPNSQNFDLDSLNRVLEENKILAEVGLDNFSENEITDFGVNNLEKLNLSIDNADNQIKILIQKAIESNQANDSLLPAIDNLLTKAKTAPEPARSNLLEKASNYIEKVKENQAIIESVRTGIQKLKTDKENNQKLKEDLAKFNEEYAEAIKNKTSPNKVVAKYKESIKELVKNSGVKSIEDILVSNKDEARDNFDKSIVKMNTLETDLKNTKSRIESLKKQIATEKKKKIKEQLQNELEGEEDAISLIESELKKQQKKHVGIEKEFNKTKAESQIADVVLKHKGPVPNVTTEDLDNIKNENIEAKIEEIARQIDETRKSEVVEPYTAEKAIKDVAPNYENELKSIENSKKTEVEKAKLKNELNKKLIASAQLSIEDLNQQIANNPEDETLKTKKQILENLISEKQAEIEENNQLIAANRAESRYTTTELISELDKKYNSEIAKINNSNKSDAEKAKEINDLNKKLIGSAQLSIEDLNQQIANNPEDETLQTKKQILENLISEKQTEIEENNQLIAANRAESRYTTTELISELDKKYSNEISKIKNSNKSDAEKAKEINDLNKELIGSAQLSIEDLNQQIANNPEDETLQTKKQILENLISEKQTEIEENNQLIASSNPETTNALTKETVVSELDKKYSSEIAKINNSKKSDAEKAKEINDLNKKLIGTAELALEDINTELANNPEDEALQTKKQILENLISEKQADIEENNQLIASSNPETTNALTKETVVSELDKKYSSEIVKINNSNKSDVEKAKQVNDLNKKLIGTAELSLEDINTELANNPNDETLKTKKQILENLISEKQTEIEENNQLIANLNPESTNTLTKETVVSELDKKYSNEISKINNSKKSDTEKAKEINDLNKKLIGTAELALEDINTELANNPEDETLKSKKSILESIITEKQTEIEENNQLIASSNPTVIERSRDEVISELDKKYSNEVSKIKNSNKSDTEKAKQVNDLNKKLIGTAELALEDINTELANNPNDESLKSKKSVLESIIAEKQTEVEENNQFITSSNPRVIERGHRTAVEISRDEIISELDKKYVSNIEKIESSNKTPIEKAEAKNELTKKLIGKAELAIEDVNTELANNPNDENLNSKKSVLESIITEKQTEVEENNQLIAANRAKSRYTVTELISELDKKYSSAITKIESSNKTPIEKAEAKNELTKKLIGTAELALEDINTELANNPNDENLKSKKSVLESIIAEKQTEIEENNQLIASSNTNSSNTYTKSGLIAELDKKYISNIEKIESSNKTPIEKAEAKNELTQKLIGTAELALEDINTELANNPNDENLKSKKSVLESIITEKQTEIEENNQLIASSNTNSSNTYTKSGLIAELDKKYKSSIEKIESSNKTPIEKAEAKNELTEKLIGKAELALEDINTELANNPTDENLKSKKSVLESIISEKQTEVEENNQLIADANTNTNTSSTNKTVVSIGELSEATYQSSEANKEVEKIQKDVEKVNQFENEIAELEKDKTNASSKEQEKIDKKIAKLQDKQIEAENEVLEKTSDINNQEKKELSNQIAEVENNVDPFELTQENDSLTARNNEIQSLEAEIERLKLELASEKDEKRRNEISKEIFEKEQRLNILLGEVLVIRKKSKINSDLSNNLVNSDVLIAEKIERGEISSLELEEYIAKLEIEKSEVQEEITSLEQEIYKSKNKKKRQVLESNKSDLEVKRKQLIERIQKLNIELEKIRSIEQEIAEINKIDNLERDNSANPTNDKNLIESDAYRAYYENKKESELIENELQSLNKKVDSIQKTRSFIIEEAIVETQGAEDAISKENEAKLTKSNQVLDDILNRIAILKQQRNALKIDAESSMADLTDAQKNKIRAHVDNDVEPIEPIIVQNTLLADFRPPTTLQKSIFRITDKSPYTESNPIPIDESQPSGLVYKVQVGAFSRPIKPEVYKEFAPLSAQKIPNSGLIRYMVGYFNNKSIAYQARNQVRTMGYSDAFVVAYCDGERISVGKADRMIADGTCKPTGNIISNPIGDGAIAATSTPLENVKPNNQLKENSVENIANGDAKILPQTQEDSYKVEYYKSVPDAAEANQVEIVKGLFFTVQCGVYNRPVKASRLFNISPLNSQLTEKNQIRYSSGMFNSVKKALVKRAAVREKGISDAFVTAYMNGKRIPVYKARNLLKQYGDTILFDYQNKLLPETASGKSDVSVKVEEEKFDKNLLSYRVILANANDPISGEKGYTFYLDNLSQLEVVENNGKQLIVSKEFKTLKEVEEKRQEFSNFGLQFLTILSLYDGNNISLEKAKEIENK